MNRIDAKLPIAEVTVYEDRAQVMRRGLVHFSQGRSELVIDSVASVLVDKTLSVEVHGPVAVTSVLIERSAVADTAGAEARDGGARERQGVAPHTEMTERMMKRLEQDVVDGNVDEDRWTALWRQLCDMRVKEAHEATSEQETRTTDATVGLETTSIRVEFNAETPGPHPVQVDYLVPNATWRPHYRLALPETDHGPADLDVGAYIWQHTGEDWSDAALVLSTQRISRESTVPALPTEYVDTRAADSPEDATDAVEVAARPHEGALMPDDEGAWIRFAVDQRTTVPSTRRGVRTSIERRPVEATTRRLVEGDDNVRTTVCFRHSGERPLLCGPVELLEEGGWCERSVLSRTLPDSVCTLVRERDPSLTVHRLVRKSALPSRRMSSWSRALHTVDIKLTNLDKQAKHIEIRDAVPDPSSGDVRVELQSARKLAEGSGKDLRWGVTIPPLGCHSVSFEYVVESKTGVAVEA